jgi:pantothenate kinase
MDNDKAVYNFNVNSFNIKAEYYTQDINEIFLPLVRQLDKMRENADRRLIVYLAGPCGAGKTTLSLLLETLITVNTSSTAQAVGIDGFHYGLEYLNSHYVDRNGSKVLMRDVKGSAETYDFEKLYDKIAALRHSDIYWPCYDRVIHDVSEDFIFVNGQIVIVEGNWLLLDEPRWRDIAQFCDYSIFIVAEWETLISRLIERKIMGGLSEEEAKAFFMRSDAKNIERILNHRLKCNLELKIKEGNGHNYVYKTR